MPVTIGPFSNVPAPGDPITSPWAQQLTQYAVDTRGRIVFAEFPANGGNWVAPNDGTTEWLGLNLTVPAWATGAIVQTTINRLLCDGVDGMFALKLWADGAAEAISATPSRIAPNVAGSNSWTHTWPARVVLSPGGGTKRFQVKVLRETGTCNLFVNAQSASRMLIQYT